MDKENIKELAESTINGRLLLSDWAKYRYIILVIWIVLCILHFTHKIEYIDYIWLILVIHFFAINKSERSYKNWFIWWFSEWYEKWLDDK